MRRRDFITLLGGAAAAWPLAARAQQAGRMKQVGYVGGHIEDAYGRALFTAFREGLAARGWVEGRNVEIIARYGSVDPDLSRAYIAEMLRLVPDVIVTAYGGTTAALLKETRTIPLVVPQMTDPVAQGWVKSLARPGGNLTGFATFEPAIGTKWLELLRELVPALTRVIFLVDPLPETDVMIYTRAIEPAAKSLGIAFTAAHVRNDAEVEQIIATFAGEPKGGLMVPYSPWFSNRSVLIIESAARYRLPAVYPGAGNYAKVGGLISYGPDILDQYRRVGDYVDRILKGANPADLPVQFPTKFELVVNLKTAKAIGLTIPETFLVRADEVIE